MGSNKNLILGIAAGVAALAVVGVICKRKGYLDQWMDKAEDMGNDLKDKFNNVKDSAKKEFDSMVKKGEDIAHKASEKVSEKANELKNNEGRNPATT